MFPFFVFIPSAPSQCPHCKEIESTKTVCNHCGHVYKEDDDDDKIAAWAGLICIVVGLISSIFMTGAMCILNCGFMDYAMQFLLGAVVTLVGMLLLAGLVWIVATLFLKD